MQEIMDEMEGGSKSDINKGKEKTKRRKTGF